MIRTDREEPLLYDLKIKEEIDMINVRLYMYAHFQNTKIEKQVQEMLKMKSLNQV